MTYSLQHLDGPATHSVIRDTSDLFKSTSSMSNLYPSIHYRPTANEPPRKRAKLVCEDLVDNSPKSPWRFTDPSSPPVTSLFAAAVQQTAPSNTMAEAAAAAANIYIPYTSLEPISIKIKKLQSDLSSATDGQCWGPGKQKVLDCKHNAHTLAFAVEQLDVDSIARKKSLDMLVQASIDNLFTKCLRKTNAAVDDKTKSLISDVLDGSYSENAIKSDIRNGLDTEPDLLLNFEVKFMKHFKLVLSEAVANAAAERSKRNFLEQLEGV